MRRPRPLASWSPSLHESQGRLAYHSAAGSHMRQLDFTHIYDYYSEDDSVAVPVILRVGAKQVWFAASIDTGASFCVFGAEIAEALGLTLDRGVAMRFRTANSAFEGFGHEVEIRLSRRGRRGASDGQKPCTQPSPHPRRATATFVPPARQVREEQTRDRSNP